MTTAAPVIDVQPVRVRRAGAPGNRPVIDRRLTTAAPPVIDVQPVRR